MRILPHPYSNQLTLEEGVSINIFEETNISDTFSEELDDLQVIVWVQDNETRFVLQSEPSDLTVGMNEINEADFQIFPNPANDILYINGKFVK